MQVSSLYCWEIHSVSSPGKGMLQTKDTNWCLSPSILSCGMTQQKQYSFTEGCPHLSGEQKKLPELMQNKSRKNQPRLCVSWLDYNLQQEWAMYMLFCAFLQGAKEIRTHVNLFCLTIWDSKISFPLLNSCLIMPLWDKGGSLSVRKKSNRRQVK